MIAIGFLFLIVGFSAATLFKIDEYSSRGRALCVILPIAIGALLIINYGFMPAAHAAAYELRP